MPVVYSTCSNDNQFCTFKNSGRISAVQDSVIIKGGAGVQHPKTLETPKGAATVVTDEQLEMLNADPHFQKFIEEGYMSVDEKANYEPSPRQIEKEVDKNLTELDASAQDTSKTYKNMNKKAPVEVE